MSWYAIATYDAGGNPKAAWVLGSQLYDAAEACAACGREGTALLGGGLDAALRNWAHAAPEISRAARAVAAAAHRGDVRPLPEAGVRLCAPFAPTRIFATASNYREHAQEMGTKLAARSESEPYIFLKAETSVNDPGAPVVMPKETQKLDWEVELGVVIGRGGRHIPVERALEHVAGYVVFNDVSARDLNRRTDYPFTHDWFRGKSFDTFGPMGPWLVPSECVADPQALRLALAVNGQPMQDGTTAEMIFTVAEQIAYLSRIVTLRPGDLIATGTPTGVGMGRGVYLKPGDVMTATVEGIGTIENAVVAESAEAPPRERERAKTTEGA